MSHHAFAKPCRVLTSALRLPGEPRDSDSEGYCPMHYAAGSARPLVFYSALATRCAQLTRGLYAVWRPGEGHLETVRVLVEEGRVDETLKVSINPEP